MSDQTHAFSGRRDAMARAVACALGIAMALGGGCAATDDSRGAGARAEPSAAASSVRLPLRLGWFEGEVVQYVTTDVSNADIARAEGANYAPRLVDAVPRGPRMPGRASAVDTVYKVFGFTQASVFASAPTFSGRQNEDRAYSPLWLMVRVTWQPGVKPRLLRSEEEVLEAEEKKQVVLEQTDVVINCPIVWRSARGGLPGVRIE